MCSSDLQGGTGNYLGYYDNGALKMRGQMQNGQKIGSWDLLGKDGKLIGHYKIGFDQDTHRYADVTNSTLAEADRITHPREMWYALVDQMLVRQGPNLTDGLIVFGG